MPSSSASRPTFHAARHGLGQPHVAVQLRATTTSATSPPPATRSCKALFLGGVTRRFPELRFAFLEGGVGWACSLFADLVGHWEKRNREAVRDVRPRAGSTARSSSQLLREARRPASRRCATTTSSRPTWRARRAGGQSDGIDDFAAAGIETPDDLVELFVPHFYFGCEADDPTNALGLRHRASTPFGAKLSAIFSSDIGHLDVPDMTDVLEEAYELVEHGLLDDDDFRDFVFANAVRLYTGTNPKFFDGTVVEDACRAEIEAHAVR